MKLSLALFLLIALEVILYPEDSEASPARRRQQQQLMRGGRRTIARQARRKVLGRAGKKALRRRAKVSRRGRTNVHPVADEPVAEEDADVAAEAPAEEVPAWCNPADPMGAWLNFNQIRIICGERGFSDFGPYGGVPAVEEGAHRRRRRRRRMLRQLRNRKF